ncbi:MAG: NADH-quinone oxidoreductase subunit A [Planctomycetota bacterium]
MDQNLFSLGVFVALIGAVAFGGLVTSTLVGLRRKGFIKEEPYECGVPQVGETRTEFNVRFFVLSMLFVLFDIETVLLAPYAVTMIRDIDAGKGLEYISEVAIFLGVLGFGLLYAWRKGVLDWNVRLGESSDDVVRSSIAELTDEKKAA